MEEKELPVNLVDDRDWNRVPKTRPPANTKILCLIEHGAVVFGVYLGGLYWDETRRFVWQTVVGWLPLPTKGV